MDYAKEKIFSRGSGEDRGGGRSGDGAGHSGDVTANTEARTRPRTWVQERLDGDGRDYGERHVTQVRDIAQVRGPERFDGDGRDYAPGANSPTNLHRVQERLDGDGRAYLAQANTVFPQANTVFCGNLAFDMAEQSLLQVMSKCGEVFLMCS